MKIDLCKIFGVEEGEEFKFKNKDGILLRLKYQIKDNKLLGSYLDKDCFSWSCLHINELNDIEEIIKLPKKKQFTDDELAIMRSIPKNFKWIVRDLGIDCAVVFKDKPTKSKYGNWVSEGDCCILSIFNHLFKCIQWEDEEPVFIDDYVER